MGYKLDVAIIRHDLGNLYYTNGEYKQAITCHKKSIKILRKLEENNIGLLIICYCELAKIYYKLGNEKRQMKIVQTIESMEPLYSDKTEFYGIIGVLYFMISHFDKSIVCLWKSIKNTKNRLKLPFLYYYLSQAYMKKNDMEKAWKMISNAKSCSSIVSLWDNGYREIYCAFANFYYMSQNYQNALECYNIARNYSYGIKLQEIMYFIGKIYFEEWNNDKALEIFSEIKNFLLSLTEVDKNFLLIVYSHIGELYNRNDNIENAYNYFGETFKLVKFYNYSRLDGNLTSFELVFSYFFDRYEFKKCELIVSKAFRLLKTNIYKRSYLVLFLILRAKLFMIQNDISEVELCLNEAEEILSIQEILLNPQRNIKFPGWNEIQSCIEIAKIYIDLNKNTNYSKAEKILKYCEKISNIRLLNIWRLQADVDLQLGNLYFKQCRYYDSREYYKKSLDLYKTYLNDKEVNNKLCERIAEIEYYIKDPLNI